MVELSTEEGKKKKRKGKKMADNPEPENTTGMYLVFIWIICTSGNNQPITDTSESESMLLAQFIQLEQVLQAECIEHNWVNQAECIEHEQAVQAEHVEQEQADQAECVERKQADLAEQAKCALVYKDLSDEMGYIDMSLREIREWAFTQVHVQQVTSILHEADH